MTISARAVALEGLRAPVDAIRVATRGLITSSVVTVVNGSAAVTVAGGGAAAAIADVVVTAGISTRTRVAEVDRARTAAAVDRSSVGLSLTVSVGRVTVAASSEHAVAVGYAERVAVAVLTPRAAEVADSLARAAAVADVGLRGASVVQLSRASAIADRHRVSSMVTRTRTVLPMAFTITRGDSLPTLDATLTTGGSPQNVTGATVQLVALSPTRAQWTHGMTVVSGAAGTVRCTFTEEETAALELGTHRAFIRVEFGDGSTLTFPEGDTGFEMTVARGPG